MLGRANEMKMMSNAIKGNKCPCGRNRIKWRTSCDFCGLPYYDYGPRIKVKADPTAICEKCKVTFEKGLRQDGNIQGRKYCYACRPQKVKKTEAEKWLGKKPAYKQPPGQGDIVAYSFFRSKYGISKKFSVRRG
jgi:hypothetical protein